MSQKTVGVIGATGLIGSTLVALLKEDAGFETIRLIVRRLVSDADPKIVMKLVNFEDYESLKLAIDGCSAVFCAVGTTQKKVQGDKIAYRKADYDIPVNAARACLETKVAHYLLVSSVGANANSATFYLRLKGEVEEAVQKFPIPSISIFRPSVLLGDRKEFRLGERIGQSGMKIFSPFLKGKWSRYKAVHAEDVAGAMLQASKNNQAGFKIYEYTDIKKMLSKII